MSVFEDLLRPHQRIVDELLSKHGLSVQESTRDMLAKSVMHSRRENLGAHTAMPALRKAATHARALLRYTTKPPTRSSSIPNWCEKLVKALNSDALVWVDLSLAEPRFDPKTLVESLEKSMLDAKELKALLHAIQSIERRRQNVGAPRKSLSIIIRRGCMAWKHAGQYGSYTWDEDEDSEPPMPALSGPLPKFLRDLLAVCNEKQPTDRALHGMIANCKKSDLF